MRGKASKPAADSFRTSRHEFTAVQNGYSKIENEAMKNSRHRLRKMQKVLKKKNDKLKLTAAFAMIMALDRAIRCGCVSDESVFDSRGMLVL